MALPKGVSLILTEKRINMLLLGVPSEDEVQEYLNYFIVKKVKHFFIATKYEDYLKAFADKGIIMHHIEFEDGNAPPQNVIDEFLEVFEDKARKPDEYIAVACKRGYGRAPTLAAIAMIHSGFSPVQTLTRLRKYNPRFITERQKQFILSYDNVNDGGCCVVF